MNLLRITPALLCWPVAFLILLSGGEFALGQGTNPVPRLEASAPATNASGPLDYSSFRIISDRNIFNPNRASRTARAEARRPVKVETFSLLGTLSSGKGRFAFFDGSSSQYRKVAKAHDTIAGYKVTELSDNHVKIEADGKAVELRVGMQMRRQDDGEWLLVAQSDYSASVTSSTPPAESAAAGSSGDESDLVKRLMQKREQELNK